MRGTWTEDLRIELNRIRAGKDARIFLERARECRQNIKGRNLDGDFGAAAPPSPGNDRVDILLAGVGCAALVDHLRAVASPSKFGPHLPKKYDSMSNPSEFLHVYATAITATGGNGAIMVSYFHVALTGLAWTWHMNLSLRSIYSWEELCVLFTMNLASA
jgi:hypothetical protein